MGLWARLFGRGDGQDGPALADERDLLAADGRHLDVPGSANLRELGGFATPAGPTRMRRYLRCGTTRGLSAKERRLLLGYGVTHVLDLRGRFENPEGSCAFAHERGVTWRNVELYHADVSSGPLVVEEGEDEDAGGFYLRTYLAMLSNHEAVRQIVGFLAGVPEGECALFHCAAGMDRTGVTSMLLLGAVGVSREDLNRDYLYSFASVSEVDRCLRTGEVPRAMTGRMRGFVDVMGKVYDRVTDVYGSVGGYLRACGVTDDELAVLRTRLVGDGAPDADSNEADEDLAYI